MKDPARGDQGGPDLRYITRIDCGRNHCYQVRIPPSRTKSGAEFRMIFTDHAFGGRAQALASAIFQRDCQLRLKNPEVVPRLPHSRYSTDPTEVQGVRLMKTDRAGGLYWYWRTTWPVNGTSKTKCFPLRKYGYAGGWYAALALRREKTGIPIPDIPPPPPPREAPSLGVDYGKPCHTEL